MSHVMCQVSGVTCHMTFFILNLFFDKVLELVGRGSVINGAYPVLCSFFCCCRNCYFFFYTGLNCLDYDIMGERTSSYGVSFEFAPNFIIVYIARTSVTH